MVAGTSAKTMGPRFSVKTVAHLDTVSFHTNESLSKVSDQQSGFLNGHVNRSREAIKIRHSQTL